MTTGLVAGALLTTSTVAAAASGSSAQKLSLANAKVERVNTRVQRTNQQAGGFPFLIVFVVIAAGLGLYFAVNNDDDDVPTASR